MLAGAGASVCLCLAVWAAAWGWAEFRVLAPRAAMAAWEAGGSVPGPEEWRWAADRVRSSRALNPLDADLTADEARIHEWQAWARPLGDPAGTAYRRAAVAFHGEALARRPTWGYAWIRMAENALVLQGVGPRTGAWIEHAGRLAPWEPVVQEKLTRLGFAAWDRLGEPARRSVEEAVARRLVLGNDVVGLVRDSVRHGWHERLRPMLGSPGLRETLDYFVQEARSR